LPKVGACRHPATAGHSQTQQFHVRLAEYYILLSPTVDDLEQHSPTMYDTCWQYKFLTKSSNIWTKDTKKSDSSEESMKLNVSYELHWMTFRKEFRNLEMFLKLKIWCAPTHRGSDHPFRTQTHLWEHF
jgi:hypothetical protein